MCAWHDFKKVGGPGHVVEVDESFLFRRKDNKGRLLATSAFCVFGGIDRTTGQSFALLVPYRTRATLIEVMRQFILPGTNLVSDRWSGYNDCAADLGFVTHSVIIHQRNFIMPPLHEPPILVNEDFLQCAAGDRNFIGPLPEGVSPFRVHTQTCERQWRSLKEFMRCGGPVTEERLESYVGSWVYFQNIKDTASTPSTRVARFMKDIRRVYPGYDQIAINDTREEPCLCNSCA